MIIEVILLLVVVFLFFIHKDRKPANMPPGPIEIPFLGSHLPSFNEKKCNKLRETYGDIVTLRTGDIRAVVIFDYKTAKETFAKPDINGRPEFFKSFSLDEERVGGVAISSGAQWVHDRRFFIRNLRNLGMGKSYLEVAVHEEAQALVDDLLKYGEEPIDYPSSFRTAALNIIWQMIASRRYDLRSEEVSAIYQATKDMYKGGELAFVSEYLPVLKKLPKFIFESIFKPQLIESYLSNMKIIVDKAIDEHEKDFDPENPRDLIDEYFLEMKSAEKEGKESLCRKGALRQIVADSFDAGSDTINNMLIWLVFLMVKYPEITKNAQKIIDEVVPRDRLVSLEDKINLPFIEAYIAETYRYSCVVMMTVDRVATEDTTINGYSVPKGTAVLASIYTIQTDEKSWDDPNSFKPERFLDDEGKYHSPDKGFMLFGSGRRNCAGETLAKMEYFLFASAILQNLDIKVPQGQKFDDQVFCDWIGFRRPAKNEFTYTKRA